MPPSKKGAPPPRDRTCGNCLHFKADADAPSSGECRANPPAVLYDPEEGVFSEFPPANADEWCGQHKGAH